MSGIAGKIEGLGNTVALKGKGLIDKVISPEKRNEILAWLQTWTLRNPKIAAFLLSNIVMTAPPLILFGLFAITVFIFSLIVALLVGLLAAVAFTLFAVGTALVIVLPTVFFTTLTATFFFLVGLGGFYLMRYFNKGETPAAPDVSSIGDTLNSMTGGRLDFVMDAAKKTQDEGKIDKYEQKHGNKDSKTGKEGDHVNGTTTGTDSGTSNGTANSTANGTPKKPNKLTSGASDAKKGLESGANTVSKNANVSNATDKVTKVVDANGVTKKVPVVNQATGTLGTVKGGLSGATGL